MDQVRWFAHGLSSVTESKIHNLPSVSKGNFAKGYSFETPAGTWDAKEKTYKAYAFGDDFPGALVETGQFEGNDLVFRSEFAVEGTTLKLRKVTRLTGPGLLVSDEFMAMKDAPETLLVPVEAKKK